jgi:dTDP-4-dehydrorhamnose 3,5-epimerase-like enzyme
VTSRVPETTSIDDCRLVRLPRIHRVEGDITPIEAYRDVPFPIARVYYIYDVPAGASRGAHAHHKLEQLIVSVIGSFSLVLKDGRSERRFELRHADVGLYIPRLIWRELVDFSHGGISVVLASDTYDADDYIRDYDEFLRVKDVA